MRMLPFLIAAVLVLAALAWWLWPRPARLNAAEVDAALALPLAAPGAPLRVFHLGHSLVGRDMPAMLAQLAPDGHRYDSQLGWGTPLKAHWEPGEPINGFEAENAHPRYRAAREAIGSGAYDAVILTEMVELRDAVRYHDSARYLAEWAQLAQQGNPQARIYLYESWHRLDDEDGWLARIDSDLPELWLGELLRPAVARTGRPNYLIPAGQVMARLVRKIEAAGGIGGLTQREDLFARDERGGIDPIHVNDLGAYLVALTHYAVLYHRSPVGLPHELLRADGSPADAPSRQAARLMQETVWEVVTSTPGTGVVR